MTYSLKIEIIMGVCGALAMLLASIAIYYTIKQRREKKAFIVVEEEDEELVSLLKCPPVEGPFPDPHPSLFWWKEEGIGGVAKIDVSEQFCAICQELIESQEGAGMRIFY